MMEHNSRDICSRLICTKPDPSIFGNINPNNSEKKPINIETFFGIWEDAPLSLYERMFAKDGKVDESIIREHRNHLRRELSYEELRILQVLQENGILLREEDFKPFTGFK